MLLKRTIFFAIPALLSLFEFISGPALAQMPEDLSGLPIPTTMVLARPAPGRGFEGNRLITVGVGKAIYRFILKDAYTNNIYVRWPSIWEQARQSSPNLNAEGQNAEQFAQVKPGATVTISGFYKAAQRCFEVMTVDDGDHRFDGGGNEQNHY